MGFLVCHACKCTFVTKTDRFLRHSSSHFDIEQDVLEEAECDRITDTASIQLPQARPLPSYPSKQDGRIVLTIKEELYRKLRIYTESICIKYSE